MGTKLRTHLYLCTEVGAEQDLAVQSFVFAKAVLHVGMKTEAAESGM